MQAQLSLEYLLLLAAFFACLLFLVPAINNTLKIAEFGLDVRNGEQFVNELEAGIERMQILGEGSSVTISGRAINNWELKKELGKIVLIVGSSELGREKEIEREVNAEFFISDMKIKKEINLKLEKNGEKVLVVNGDG